MYNRAEGTKPEEELTDKPNGFPHAHKKNETTSQEVEVFHTDESNEGIQGLRKAVERPGVYTGRDARMIEGTTQKRTNELPRMLGRVIFITSRRRKV